MSAKIIMGFAFCSSLFVAGNCFVGPLVPESYGSMDAMGGAPCYYCTEQAYCMNPNQPCMYVGVVEGVDYWNIRTFHGITQRFCKDYEKWGETGTGQDMCMGVDYMACTSVTWCSQMDCPAASCGEPSVEEKTTMCDYTDAMECMIGS
jgi:hypothetical protein